MLGLMTDRPLMINHVEMVYRPGQVDFARAFFETLGFAVSEYGPWLIIMVDPVTGNGLDNVMYCNEAVPAHQRFEEALERAIKSDSQLSAALDHYRDVRRAHPQYNFHFGVTLPSIEEWKARVERVQEASRSHPLLAGHLEVMVFDEGHPDSVGPASQAFCYTDILASATLPMGLMFEIQYMPVPDSGDTFSEELWTGKFPDLTQMV
jgi:hypothetical protein